MNTLLDPSPHHSPSATDSTDDELMSRINAGDVEASLAELRKRHGKRVHRLVLGVLGDTHLADDVRQEVFAKVFFKSHLFRPGTNFTAWLCEVARNQALTTLRTRRRAPTPVSSLLRSADQQDETELLEEATPYDAGQAAEEHELMTALDRAIEELPDPYREVFTLCAQQGVQYRQVADQLDIPTGTVAIRLMRARRRLYDALAPHFGRIRRPPACFVN